MPRLIGDVRQQPERWGVRAGMPYMVFAYFGGILVIFRMLVELISDRCVAVGFPTTEHTALHWECSSRDQVTC